jgi:Xaa-Pro aminopeptidase
MTYQSFEAPAAGADHKGRLEAIRQRLEEQGVDAFLVPRADEHQGEYVPASAERLKWITGFTGSAGLAAITRRASLLLVDGRYTVQARTQVDQGLFEIAETPEAKLTDWLKRQLPAGGTVGFDPWLHTLAEHERLTSALEPARIRLKAVARNPLDLVWGRERPLPPLGPITCQDIRHAGRATSDKVADVRRKLAEDGHDVAVLTLTDSIAWLLNIRGSDVKHTPVVLAFAIVPRSGKVELFVDARKVKPEAARRLAPVADVVEPAGLGQRLGELARSGARVRVDADWTAFAIVRRLGGAKRIKKGADPCIALKAVKNAAEIEGARAAHVRDGLAFVRFLSWLDAETAAGSVDEIAAARQLEALRSRSPELREIAFDTISGAGPNGAIVHYRVTRPTCRMLGRGELYLVDSGGQYVDGTTDITRTIAIGKPSKEMRERYTLVLKGHIAISAARFPKGTRGIDLDPLARQALWACGLDYAHGTGHGVGSYLSVHEGPQSISRRGMAELEPGMIVSNEPGYYKEGAYGIRIENLLVVTPPAPIEGGDRPMMGFETLTLAPYDRRLIEPELLAEWEASWIDAYHARVVATLSAGLEPAERQWLAEATAPLASRTVRGRKTHN